MTDGFTHVEHVMGMAVSIDVRGVRRGCEAVDDVVSWLHWVDATFSTYNDASEIRRMDRGVASVSPEVDEVLALGEQLRVETEGYFDVRADGRLDPSGVVKGWAVERASAMLAAEGITRQCVNAGGDIRARGGSWRVGIAHPLVAGAMTAVIEVDDGAVATSGIAERGAHVVNPRTGRRAIDLASVTVVGPDLTFADGYATAALAMGMDAPAWLATLPGHDAMVIDAGGMVWESAGWAARVVLPVH